MDKSFVRFNCWRVNERKSAWFILAGGHRWNCQSIMTLRGTRPWSILQAQFFSRCYDDLVSRFVSLSGAWKYCCKVTRILTARMILQLRVWTRTRVTLCFQVTIIKREDDNSDIAIFLRAHTVHIVSYINAYAYFPFPSSNCIQSYRAYAEFIVAWHISGIFSTWW